MEQLGYSFASSFVQRDDLGGHSLDVTEVGWEQRCVLLLVEPVADICGVCQVIRRCDVTSHLGPPHSVGPRLPVQVTEAHLFAPLAELLVSLVHSSAHQQSLPDFTPRYLRKLGLCCPMNVVFKVFGFLDCVHVKHMHYVSIDEKCVY